MKTKEIICQLSTGTTCGLCAQGMTDCKGRDWERLRCPLWHTIEAKKIVNKIKCG